MIVSGPEVPIIEPIRKVGKIILNQLEESPDHVIQIDPISGKCVTFREMKESSKKCALWLRKQNVGANDVVSFCGNDRIDGYIPLLASIYVGSIFNGWDHLVALDPARRLMNQVKPKIMFCIKSSLNVLVEAARLENLHTKFVVSDKSDEIGDFEYLMDILNQQSTEEVDNFEPRELESLEEPGLIIFTSGSTGLPKGAVFSYRSIFTNFYVKSQAENEIVMSFSTLFWISGILWTLRSIADKMTKVNGGNLDVIESLKAIENYKINLAVLSPPNLTRLSKSGVLRNEKRDLSSLRIIITGGATTSQEVFDDLRECLPHVDFHNRYGLTEICGSCSVSKNKITSVGFLKSNFKLKVIDSESLKILGPGEVGELYFKTHNMMSEYYKNRSMTKQAFDSDGWFRSGDLGYYTQDGEIFLVGRLKELIKYRNYQVSPTELENHLLTHPAVEAVAVVPKDDLEDGQRPMAFVVKLQGTQVTEDDIVKFSSKLGPNQTLWGGVQFLDKLPFTPSGKVAKQLLRDMI